MKCSKIVHGCEEYVELLNLADHIKSRHNCFTAVTNYVKGVERWESQNDFEGDSSCFRHYHHLQFNGNDFFTKLAYHDNLIHFWVYLVGTDEETNEYGFNIRLGSNKDGNELCYKSNRVCSLFTSQNLLFNGNSGHFVLSLSRSTVNGLITENFRGHLELEYKFEITKQVRYCNLYS